MDKPVLEGKTTHVKPNKGDDIDPMAAESVVEFAAVLRRLRVRAGSPSYRQLEQWGKRRRRRLPRSSVSDALGGKRLPSRDLLLAFVEACGVDPVADSRWIATWTKLAQQGVGDDIGENFALSEQLISDVRSAGLMRLGSTYLAELEWKELFAGVRELDIFVAYGQTWRHLHARELSMVAAREDARIRVFLADPDDAQTIAVLADRFSTSTAELKTRIENTRCGYEELRRSGGADLEIYYWPGDRMFSFYRFDDVAVVGFYSHTRARTAAVPVFVCSKPGELFQFVLDELATVQRGSRPVCP